MLFGHLSFGLCYVLNRGTEGIKSITEVIQRYEVHVGSRLIASVPLIRNALRANAISDPREEPAYEQALRVYESGNGGGQ